MTPKTVVLRGIPGKACSTQIERATTLHARPRLSFLFVLDGEPLVCSADERSPPHETRPYTISVGQGVLFKPWLLHSFRPTRPNRKTHILSVCIDSEWLEDARLSTWPHHLANNNSETDTAEQKVFDLVQSTIREIFENRTSAVELLQRIFLSLSSVSPSHEHRKPSRPIVRDYRIRRALTYLSERVGEDFLCGKIASAAGLSRPHFFRTFKEHTGLTPRLFYNALRLERAENSLLEIDTPVQEIALDLGFSAPGNFTRFFKNHVGISPNEYRGTVIDIGACDPNGPCRPAHSSKASTAAAKNGTEQYVA